MIIAISVVTRTGYNEQIRLDLGACYIRFLLYFDNEYFFARALALTSVRLFSLAICDVK